MKTKKSAKDIAFERERVKFRSEIKALERELKNCEKECQKLTEIIRQNEEKIRQQDDWIQRLLEYTELSENEMRNLVEKDLITAEAMSNVASAMSLIGFGSKMFR